MEIEATPFNPWLEIWYRPRQTIRRIVAHNPNKYVWILAIVSGIGGLLIDYASISLGENPDQFYLLLSVRLLLWGVVWGVIGLQISAYASSKIGRWLGGNATLAAVRAAGIWSALPVIVCYHLLWLPQIPLLQAQVQGYEMSWTATFALLGIMLCRVIAAFWGM